MALFELTKDSIIELEKATFASKAISERADLQRLLKQRIHAISPETLVIAEEFSEWDESKRRIDLLGLDRSANLVVIELKRTEDGGHMELQALRYAAMVSAMTFTEAVEVFGRYLQANGRTEDAQSEILQFLQWDSPNEDAFAQDVRIVLVAAEFSKEITTSVMWLNERDLDIRCVRLRPYSLESRTILDVQQIIPLPEADEFTVQLKKKAQEIRTAKKFEPDFSKYSVTAYGDTISGLSKRALALEIVRAVIKHGTSPEQVGSVIPPGRWLSMDGELSESEFQAKVAQTPTKFGSQYNLSRYFCSEDELIRAGGKTYALTNQWGLGSLSQLDELIALLPTGTVTYEKVNS